MTLIDDGTLSTAGGCSSSSGGNSVVEFISGGSLTNYPTETFTNDGTITNYDSITNEGYLDNYGTISNGGTITNAVGELTLLGIATSFSGTFDNYGALDNGITNGGSGTITNQGTLDNTGSIDNPLLGTITNSGTLASPPGSSITNTDGTVTNSGTIDGGGTVTNSEDGTITNEAGATLNSFATTNTAHVTNSGTLNIFGSYANNLGGGITNEDGATITIMDEATLTNNGVITNDAGATIKNDAGGTIDNPSELDNYGGITNSGTISNTGDEGYIYEYCGSTFTNSGGTLTGNGIYASCPSSTTLSASLNTANFGESITLTATVSPVPATGDVVTFYGGSGTSIGTGLTDSAGKATLSTPASSVGSDSFWSTFAGDILYSSSTSNVVTVTVYPLLSYSGPAASSATIAPGSSGGYVVTVTGSSGSSLGQVTLPSGTTIPTGTVTATYATTGANSLLQVSGADIPYPPGKTMTLLNSVGATDVCIVDSAQSPTSLQAGTCGATNLANSEVILQCNGESYPFPPFVGPVSSQSWPAGTPQSRTFTCTATTQNGLNYLQVSGLAYGTVIIDGTPPVLTIPSSITTHTALGSSVAVVDFSVTATDSLDPSPLVTCSSQSGSTFPIGTTIVSCTATDAAGNSATGSFQVTVIALAAPTITTSLSSTSIIPAESFSDSVTLQGATSNAGGTVTFYLYFDSSCTGFGDPLFPVTVTNGVVPPLTGETGADLGGDGSYGIVAVYSGDSSNDGATSACEPLTVGQADTATITASVYPPGSTMGSSLSATDTATLSGGYSPTGQIVFFVYYYPTSQSTPGCNFDTDNQYLVYDSTANVNGNGQYSSGSYTPTEGPGYYYWVAQYGGDSNNQGVSTECGAYGQTFVVQPATPFILTLLTADNPTNQGSIALGGSSSDTATFQGGYAVTGSLVFSAYTSASCTGTPAFISATIKVSGDGPYTSSPFTPSSLGTYYWQATYSGDANNNGATSACGGPGETLTVNQAASSISTSVFDASTGTTWSGTETLGASAYDTATVTGQAGLPTPTGTVTYTFFTSGGCTGTGVPAGTVTLTSSGAVPNSNTQGPLGAGLYSFQASYSGDSGYQGSTSACESYGVAEVTATTISVVRDASSNAPWSGSEVTGAAAYDTATVAGEPGFTPTGTITYSFYSGTSCTGTAITQMTGVLSSGVAPTSRTTGALAAGQYAFQGSYGGDSNYLSSTSSCESFKVNTVTPSVATTVYDSSTSGPWSGTEVAGASAYDGSTVTGASGFPPTGTLTYTFYSTSGSCSGTFTTGTVTLTGGSVPNSATTAALAPGSYSFEASYGGDSNYNGATSSCESFTVNKATAAISTMVNPSTSPALGTAVSDTATAAGVAGFQPTGTVTITLYAGSTCTGTIIASQNAVGLGTASTGETLPAGQYSYEATAYSGDSNYMSGTRGACEPFAVSQAQATVGTAIQPGASEPLGTVTYDTSTIGGTVSGFTPSGQVTYNFYSGGLACAGTSTTQQVSVTAGAVPASSSQTLPAGSYSYIATYSGDSNYIGQTSLCESLTILKGTATISTTVNPSSSILLGTRASDTASATGVAGFPPTGSVTITLYQGTACSGTPVASQTAVALGSPSSGETLPAGEYSYIAASYSGDANYASGASGPCEQFTVTQAQPTISTTVQPGATEPLGTSTFDTASIGGTVSGFTPTGSVTYNLYSGSLTCGGSATSQTVAVGGGGTVPSSTSLTPAAGSYSYSVTYSGDTNYLKAAGPCEPLTIQKGTASISSTVNPSTTPLVGTTVSDTATATGISGFAPTGTVTITLYPGSACSGTPVSTQTGVALGVASSGVSSLSGGSYSYKATAYSGDSNYVSGSSGVCEPFTVEPTSSSTSVACSPNPATVGSGTTCTATVTGYHPTGTVTFSSSSSTGVFTPSSGQCTLGGGTCSVTYTDTTAGTATITGAYGGDASNLASKGTVTLTEAYKNCASLVKNGGGQNLAGADLEYCDLANYQMGGDNLQGANMQYTDLQNTNLQGSNMQSADLANSNAQGTSFQGANLAGATLTDVDAAGANFQGANLATANLQGATLTSDNLQGANLAQANLSGDKASGADFQGDNLAQANLSNGDFDHGQFQGANLAESNMSYGNFDYANFQGANTQGANTTGATFTGAVDPP